MTEIIPIAADHAGYALKQRLVTELRRLGYEPRDLGTNSAEFAAPLTGATKCTVSPPLYGTPMVGIVAPAGAGSLNEKQSGGGFVWPAAVPARTARTTNPLDRIRGSSPGYRIV